MRSILKVKLISLIQSLFDEGVCPDTTERLTKIGAEIGLEADAVKNVISNDDNVKNIRKGLQNGPAWVFQVLYYSRKLKEKLILNKKVLLRERKRHTARHAASHRGGGTYLGQGDTYLGWGYLPWLWGTPPWLGGYPPWPKGEVPTLAGGGVHPPQVWPDWKHYLPPSFGCGR